jgi:Pyridoxamine 5'-phosphate oxidase
MSELRGTPQRKADTLAVLERHGDAWLATASSGRPHLIAVSQAWDGQHIVIATRSGTPTARNLDETGVARLALGTPDDVVMVDASVVDSTPATSAAAAVRAAFAAAVGWDPAEQGPRWRYYRLRPVAIEAYRGYGELAGREVMREGRWLA